MTNRLENTHNPFAQCDAKDIARIIAALMPKSPPMSPEERVLFNEERTCREQAYQEARHGKLPENTYRILEQGSIVGWYYELEVAGEVITLKEPDPLNTEFEVYVINKEKAVDLAKAHIAERIGPEAAENATFRFLFGGQI